MEGFGGDFGVLLEKIQFIDPKTLKRILVDTILFLFGANLLLFFSTVIHRIWVDYRDMRYKKAYEKYTDQIVQAIFNSEDIDPPKNNIETEALGDVCIEIKRKFKGEVGSLVREIAQKYGVIDYYMHQTKSLFAYTRVTAYEKLGCLQVISVKPMLRSEIEKEKKEWMLSRLCFTYSFLVEDTEEVQFIVEKLSLLENLSF